MRVVRPPLVIVAAVLVGILAALGVMFGAYWATRIALGGVSPPPGLRPDLFSAMAVLSMILGGVLLFGVNVMWERKYGGRPLAIAAMLLGITIPVAIEVIARTGLVMIGVSWLVAVVSAFALVTLFVPSTRRYFSAQI